MKKIIISIFMLSILSLSLHSSVYKGQKYFKKKCLSCHGKAHIFVSGKDYDTWLEYLEDDASKIYSLHEDSEEAERSMKYFNSAKYQRSIKHFRDFFLEYASDTGNIPACE